MANHKTRLELTWIGKENRPKLEPRILIEDPEKSYHAPFRVGEGDLFDNRLIFGDNLLALKALEREFAGKIFARDRYAAGQDRARAATRRHGPRNRRAVHGQAV